MRPLDITQIVPFEWRGNTLSGLGQDLENQSAPSMTRPLREGGSQPLGRGDPPLYRPQDHVDGRDGRARIGLIENGDLDPRPRWVRRRMDHKLRMAVERTHAVDPQAPLRAYPPRTTDRDVQQWRRLVADAG